MLIYMTLEAERQRAQFLQITGLAFMSPFGRLVLKFFNLENIPLNLHFMIALILSLIFLYVGIIIAVRGIEILEEKK